MARAGQNPFWMRWKTTLEKEVIWAPTKGPVMAVTIRIATIFGTKVSVISWTCVSAWTSAMPTPTTIATSTAGPDGVDLTFAARPNAGRRVVIWTQSRHYGLSRITAAADAGAAAAFWVFVYP